MVRKYTEQDKQYVLNRNKKSPIPSKETPTARDATPPPSRPIKEDDEVLVIHLLFNIFESNPQLIQAE